MGSWVQKIISPFKKACTFFNQDNGRRSNKSQQGQDSVMDLHGEVMACAYEDVKVMWSILDKSTPRICNISS